jgi:hypothetical protein
MDLRRRHNLGSDLFAGPQGSQQTVEVEFLSSSSTADGSKAGTKNITCVIHTSDGLPLVNQVTVDVSRTGGSAVNGVDFEFTSPKELTFLVGADDADEQSTTVVISGANSPDCTVIFGLSNAVNATINGNTVHTLTILGGGGGEA